jgi:hypothetical protein
MEPETLELLHGGKNGKLKLVSDVVVVPEGSS